jgi:heme exporter protein A
MICAVHMQDLAIIRGERLLFQGLSLSVRAGEAVALTGANGSGKTSLLRALAGLIRPHEGSVRFEGTLGDLEPDDARSQGVHLLGHQDGFKATRTAWEELLFQVQWTGGTQASARSASAQLDLDRLADLEVRKLSAGQRRRLAMARLVASPRSLWLLDEPMAPLDTARRAVFGSLMGEHLAAGGMIIAAVHDPLPVAARAFDLSRLEGPNP